MCCRKSSEWAQWSNWSKCTKACNLGTMQRRRSCKNDIVGQPCPGSKVPENTFQEKLRIQIKEIYKVL